MHKHALSVRNTMPNKCRVFIHQINKQGTDGQMLAVNTTCQIQMHNRSLSLLSVIDIPTNIEHYMHLYCSTVASEHFYWKKATVMFIYFW